MSTLTMRLSILPPALQSRLLKYYTEEKMHRIHVDVKEGSGMCV